MRLKGEVRIHNASMQLDCRIERCKVRRLMWGWARVRRAFALSISDGFVVGENAAAAGMT